MKLQKIKTGKSKKAIVLPETLKIIIAVACIFLLIYLAVKLYEIFTLKGEIERARAELNNIDGKIKFLLADTTPAQTVSVNYLLLTPQDWALSGWPYEEYKVNYCVAKGWEKCLCMCKIDVSFLGRFTLSRSRPQAIAESCDTNRLCIELQADKISRIKINPKSFVWGFFKSDLSPIYIRKLGEDFQGNLEIGYNKETKELSIIPQK